MRPVQLPVPVAPPGLELAAGADDAVALLTATGATTYAALRDAVARTGALLGGTRRLVLLEAANDVASVTTYLAALAGGHPVLLVAPGDAARHADLVARYDPDIVQTARDGVPREVRPDTAHDLHPELAVLLSTSGSTGSPKLVRLSRTNVRENALSIAEYLGIRPTDRAITSLPLHYCYGLSVLTSHLVAGAAVVLTDLSVADECFWDLAARTQASSFAGVPYTFELLESSGFERRELPSLRYVTQAGGRLAPERVVAFAELGRRKGWDLYVMYGQTEATARMAYLPPDQVVNHPSCIGRPVPGGSFRLEPVTGEEQADPGVGELVYAGPNVMMGYAQSPEDLATGPLLTELRTGDLARRTPDGLWEVVGRLNRYAKVFGLRVDLDRIEQQLTAAGHPVRVVVRDERLRVFTTRARSRDAIRTRTAGLAGVPVGAVHVHRLEAFPVTASGKTDYAELHRHADLVDALRDEPGDVPRDVPRDGSRAGGDGRSPATAACIRNLYAALLGRPDATVTDSFVSLGGDSLSFVEVSSRLGRDLGALPSGWQHLTAEQLASCGRRRRRFLVPVDISVPLRAVALLLVLVTHADLVQVPGGAHVLLAVAGFNVARFALPVVGRRERTGRLLRTVAALAVPSAAFIAAVGLTLGSYRPATAVFLNGLLGSDGWTDDWQFWFLEALVWGYLGLAALLAVPALDRWQRTHPFGAAATALGVTLALRYAWVGVEAGPTERYSVGVVAWFLAAGWAAAAARTTRQRVALSVLVVVGSWGFFGDPVREAVVTGGFLALLWLRTLPVPTLLATPARILATASLWTYLTHWQVYPGLEAAGHPVAAVLVSVAVGACCSAVDTAVRPALTRTWVRTDAARRLRRGNDAGDDGEEKRAGASRSPVTGGARLCQH